MKNHILCICTLLLLISCATLTPEITQNDKNLHMVGGKEALLNSIYYPEFALRQGIEGIVNIMVYVDTLGIVRECTVVDGNEYLNEAAINALKAQQFHPYYINGKKSPVRVVVPIAFNINKEIDIISIEDKRLMPKAEKLLSEDIQSINTKKAHRSPGKINDYYSEGLTWWPNSKDPNGPYIIKEGKLNPKAFLAHKQALEATGKAVGQLTSLYLLTGNREYSTKALEHFRAWFIDEQTMMSPHLKYAQSIPNRSQGRSTGIYEGLPIIELVRSASILKNLMSKQEQNKFETWLKDYSKFLVYDDFGVQIRAKKNIYALAWLAQISTIAEYLNDEYLLMTCRDYFKKIIIPYVLDKNAKLFHGPSNLMFENDLLSYADYLAIIATVLSDNKYNAWFYTNKAGRRVGDVMNLIYSDLLNMRISRGEHYKGNYLSLYLAGIAYDNFRYQELWRNLQEELYRKDLFLDNVLLWE